MYNFVDINQAAEAASGLQTIYNGVNLDESSEAFTTLNVTGRSLLAPDISYTNKPAGAGGWINRIDMPVRSITVQARISLDTEAELQDYYSWLSRAFAVDEEKRLSFSDRPGYHYKAVLNSVSRTKEDSRELIYDLTFLCLDPYLYADDITVITDGNVPSNIIMPTLPEEIIFASSGVASQLKITNAATGRNIVLKTAITASSEISMVWNPPMIKANGQSIMNTLDIKSDFEEFELTAGDAIVKDAAGAITIKVREKLL